MRRGVLLVVVGLVAAAVGVVGSSSHVLRRPELATVDARFDVRGTQPPPEDVVVVGLDAKSLQKLGERPPIPRRLHARMIDRLLRADARVIAYDLQFQGRTTPADDNALFNALDRARGVVLGTSIVRAGPETPFDPLAKATGSVLGSTNFPDRSARGGAIRRFPYSELGLPTFALAAAGVHPDRDRFAGDGAWIDFAGPAGTVTTLPFWEVLAGRHAGVLRGKIVVVGLTDPILLDIHPTATSAAMPGPEINANAIATILAGFPLRDPPGWLAFLLIAGAGLLTPLAALRLTGLRWLPIPLVLAGAYLVAAQLAFDGGTVLPVAAPLAALLVGAAGTLAVAYATDLRERRHLRTAFARFVPPAVVDELVEHRAALAGVEREATVLFCDLRGFTTVAEQLGAERVIELLNRYLTEMSDAILDAGGTVVSYMGDGIMAVFGAPLPQDDHADRALRAAREMLGPRLAAFNAWAGQDLRMGVGLCSGPVMSGTVGSERRLEYAAVGDTTNTAARLEAMTKDLGLPILIADTTKAALRDPQDGLRHVGDLEVRGRGARVSAWTLEPSTGSDA
jgi:adenylate cyclase